MTFDKADKVENTKELLRYASGVVHQEWVLLLVTALGGFAFLGLVHLLLFLVALVIGLAAQVSLFGRLADRLKGKNASPVFFSLKVHGLNYLVVFLILGGVRFLIIYLASQAISDGGAEYVFESLVDVIFQVAILFILPLVFLVRSNIDAIIPGLNMLAEKHREARLLILLVAMAALIWPVFGLILSFGTVGLSPGFFSLSAVAVVGILVAYVDTVLFVAAARLVIEWSRAEMT